MKGKFRYKMNELDKILEILEKDLLSANDKEFLNVQSKNDAEVSKLISLHAKLKAALNKNGHIDEELMGEYVLYKNQLSSNNIVISLSSKIEDHLRKCESCETVFKELNSEFTSVDEFVTKTIVDQPKQQINTVAQKVIVQKRFSTLRLASLSIVSLFVVYIGLFAVSNFTTPDYKNIKFIEERESYTTRGRTTELFQRGLDALESKNYSSAVEYLEHDIKSNPNSESIFYTHFILGFTHVSKAESDFLGLFKSFDRDDVLKGIEHFEKSIELNNSGTFSNLNLDANYFIGKAFLLIDEKAKAKDHLQNVVDSKGSYYKKAEELLEKL
jgi:tetratricopeptide (TPR) repeat protein